MRLAALDDQAPEPRSGALETLLDRVSRGDKQAFETLYTAVAGAVFGLARRIVRDPAQSEEVAQEVLIEVWRRAARFDPRHGTAMAWIMTLAHSRAVDRVRSAQASAARDHNAALRDRSTPYDEVVEQVERRLEREQVLRCLEQLTELQHESVTLAYYRGCTYRETADLLGVALGTVKTRLRDGLIRLRDCLGVTA
ncbi:ECF RNA polymerase sigma factor SigK [Actinacidiphila bryophytorum]|uniref:ECF RNA polymerase sigma factor SigK n=1 Tax=Actinacidiphila bryophytorum TaxID=1436133 RepID=A0A9W4H435_9ACTN|nr:ECF RNA polymerase sigma factor SigK [Actinacidiphila bryophytorum]MBM9435797.1 ECF RNA polymerase sigma factor SigK [Actinacidiphila bryophytorum]MBN6541640.1 ECF RNA polymerase sigma factor SigK [Actinacidiphila bryophytorum]CAG7650185.1 ECF RNA polymerase sigma factor SigK [Actinacidiphila bryophytorum]